jgi:hypothetical protein
VIYQHGEPSKKAYIILEGEAYQLIPKSKQNRRSSYVQLEDSLLSLREEESVVDIFPEMNIHRVIKRGEEFGADTLGTKAKR